MSGTVKVSVIMPVYNAAPYVEEAIESVLGQHFDAFELVVGDDGSTDGTAAVLRRYARHPRVRVLTHPMNRGAAATRNALLREARGVYATPCDADDLMLPGNLRRLSGFLDAHPEIGVVYGDLLVLELGLDDELLGSPSIMRGGLQPNVGPRGERGEPRRIDEPAGALAQGRRLR